MRAEFENDPMLPRRLDYDGRTYRPRCERASEIKVNGQLLLARLSNEFPESSPQLVKFPSGSFIIELEVRGEAYVIEFVVGQGYGLSKRKRTGYAWRGVETFATLSELERGLRKLLATPQ